MSLKKKDTEKVKYHFFHKTKSIENFENLSFIKKYCNKILLSSDLKLFLLFPIFIYHLYPFIPFYTYKCLEIPTIFLKSWHQKA